MLPQPWEEVFIKNTGFAWQGSDLLSTLEGSCFDRSATFCGQVNEVFVNNSCWTLTMESIEPGQNTFLWFKQDI